MRKPRDLAKNVWYAVGTEINIATIPMSLIESNEKTAYAIRGSAATHVPLPY
ncbi:MAG: hypothetical protein LBG27_09100 [Spirochaetaceae bacterium]|jgi:hypothetical protein|nr:hypothetical protein [Spirochaetaceae bacterium]